MFAPQPGPRVFVLPPGVDFPQALAAGLRERVAGAPEAMARVEVFLNTRRMQRRVREIFAGHGAGFLPRLRLVTDLDLDAAFLDLPPPVPPLRRRLELTQLISRLLDMAPDLAPRSAIFDLADSLAGLFDEIQGEEVPFEALEGLDLADHAGHWERSLMFLRIAAGYFRPEAGEAPDPELRRRLAVQRLEAEWAVAPPRHPVIVAGSTGSRGTTARLMRAVARLPQGAVILPGFDDEMPGPVWASLDDALTADDHPQTRFRRFLASLGMGEGQVERWTGREPPNRARNRLVSLALRPAPVTDQWLEEGPGLEHLAVATEGMTLIEAPSPRMEAQAIALVLRRAAEEGRSAALITPDRVLSRQVAAALDRWGIIPDDSAGRPLALSAPGRFLRHVAALSSGRVTMEELLILLKHPLAHAAAGRGPHLLHVQALELHLRRHGPAFPTGADIRAWAVRESAREAARDAGRATRAAGRPVAMEGAGARPVATAGAAAGPDPAEDRAAWADWLAGIVDDQGPAEAPLPRLVAHHLGRARALVAGSRSAEDAPLWGEAAGQALRAAMEELLREAGAGGRLAMADYPDLLTAILERSEVREAVTPHPGVMIWGTLEARVQGADLVILGGLNDGVWPALPPPDPWLNRRLRHRIGLPLPERRVGQEAHHFQQAVAAGEVILSRALRSDEAETVASRWLNRLVNLMEGLPPLGPRALARMRARGEEWLALARRLDLPAAPEPAAPRPSPAPPVAARPKELSVTGIRTLIRDPYAIYARHVLRLRPLDPMRPAPDAALRGSVLHRILEGWVKAGADPAAFGAMADAILARDVPWPTARLIWRARLARVADWFLEREAARAGVPLMVEAKGGVEVRPGFRLTARPDRIDRLPDGRVEIVDYKTGKPPSEAQIRAFDKQLLLEAAMAARGAFAELGGPAEVAAAVYIGLGARPEERRIALEGGEAEAAWAQLRRLAAKYADPARGYTARRALAGEREGGDYDHLARFGEWDMSDPARAEPVGGAAVPARAPEPAEPPSPAEVATPAGVAGDMAAAEAAREAGAAMGAGGEADAEGAPALEVAEPVAPEAAVPPAAAPPETPGRRDRAPAEAPAGRRRQRRRAAAVDDDQLSLPFGPEEAP